MHNLRLVCSSLVASLVLLLAGCGARQLGNSSGSGLPPPMPAGAHLPRWEHYCVYPDTDLTRVLNTAGEEGWEMVTITPGGGMICFKRRRPDPVTPTPAAPASPPSS